MENQGLIDFGVSALQPIWPLAELMVVYLPGHVVRSPVPPAGGRHPLEHADEKTVELVGYAPPRLRSALT